MSVAAVVSSTLGWLRAAFVTVPQFIRATADRGDFIPAAGKTHPSFGTPHTAILIWAALVCVLGFGRDLLWNVELCRGAATHVFDRNGGAASGPKTILFTFSVAPQDSQVSRCVSRYSTLAISSR